MKIKIKFFLIASIAIGMFGLTGCSDHQERFSPPPWLGGSSIETLEEEGDYNHFLALMEKANYKEPISKQLFTLFVPNDEAFEAYFSKIGKNSIEDFTRDEAVQLFTLHVLRNPRSRFLLIYEYVWSEFQGPDQGHNGEYMSLFHRKRTPSVTTPYTDTVRYYADMAGQEVLMTSGSKYVPLFTDEWFHDYGSHDPAGDYLYMYPESSWKEGYTAGMPGTNWHSAMVLPHLNKSDELELEARTASGFIYYIDRVVEPMPSIDEYLKTNEDKYGLFYDLMQRFATFSTSGTTPEGKQLYTKSYDLINNLFQESAGSALGTFPQDMWSAFVPTNAVLQEYLDNNILKYYSSIDSVPRVTLYYIIQTQLSDELVLMSKMERAYFNAFGDPTEISRTDLSPAFMCSNGAVYESKKVLEPNVFTCVPGLLFFDKDYSTMLFVLSEADALISLANPERDVTLFASTNEKLEEYGIRYDVTNAVVEFRSPANGTWSPMSTENLVTFAQSQIVYGNHSDFSGEGFLETSSGTYVGYNNGVIRGSENQSSGNMAIFTESVKNDRNGYIIKVDKPIQIRHQFGQFLANDKNDVSIYNEDVSIFHDLLDDLGYLNTRSSDPYTKEKFESVKFFAASDRWTAFVPSDEAMTKAINEGIIPDVTVKGWDDEISKGAIDSLKNWIDYHFIIDRVILDDGNLSGDFNTNYDYLSEDGTENLNTPITIYNEPSKLTILDATGQETVIDHAKANILIKKGAVHKLDSVLKLYE